MNYTKNQITLLSFDPVYYHFKIPKKGNQHRHIEAPDRELKGFQKKLNNYLQTVYYLNQTDASYGFIIKPVGAKYTKNIYTNALKHLGNDYLMNVDFKDFFHQITQNDVLRIFTNTPFRFNKHTAHTLAKICCYKGRLPMGAPTSPVLSNLYSMDLDKKLTDWAKLHDSIYTRYVDDLCFSSKTQKFSIKQFNEVETIARKHHLIFNIEKTKYYAKNDLKFVTGLVLRDTVDIDPEYYVELTKDINRLKYAVEVMYLMNELNKKDYIKKYKQELMGKIAFIAAIEGKNSDLYLTYLNLYYEALEPPDDELVKRWTKFSNYK